MPQSARVQQQAGVVPPPAPPPPVPDAAAIAQPAPPAPPPGPAPRLRRPGPPPGTSLVGWVTGPNSPNDTIKRFAITGTDLGIMWDNGDPANNQVLMAFGDTIGYCSVRGRQWRYNTMFRTNDRALSKTVSIPNGVVNNKYSGSPLWAPALSKQVINSIKFAPSETGIIPTSGIAVGTTQYMSFMSIRSWDSPGSWTTNFSAIAVSPDNGEHWGVYPQSVRPASPDATPRVPYVPGGEKFQVGAFLKPGDGYLYSYGTPSGRGGPAFVSRVPQSLGAGTQPLRVLGRRELGAAATPGAAQPVIPAPVGEMSVQYNTYLKQFLALYCNGNNDVVARTAPAPQGPWGPEQMLVASQGFPRRHLCAVTAPVVDGQGDLLQPVAVVGLQRDVDEDGAAVTESWRSCATSLFSHRTIPSIARCGRPRSGPTSDLAGRVVRSLLVIAHPDSPRTRQSIPRHLSDGAGWFGRRIDATSPETRRAKIEARRPGRLARH